ncbi:putative ATPase [Brachyspira hampsonii 30446]|uniref:Putative ATPase n=1 Tax=Brachyspira hampsonii 30446 TaxID=1289135 RepID=A0A2U4FPR6_9SPIR|nr:AAA family ATPase [Brachyspira hampsonii]EKV57133.1 putative ATPase [Brachyspira hampsonii 30446]OEJ16935.1 ATPase [Brachyspira hampsonii]
MIKNLYIENFKCFNKIEINDFKKINFLVGKNNLGKTTILETLMLILSESRINIIENIKTISRAKENKTEIKTLFYNFNYNNNINFNYNKDNKSYNINISPILKDNKIPNDNNIELNYNTIINNDDSNDSSIEEKKITIPNLNNNIFMMGKKAENILNREETYIPSTIEYHILTAYLIEILKGKNEKPIIEMLSFFNNNIKSINVLNNDIYLNIEGMNELLILNLMGEGLKKYLSIILPIAANKNNVILADDIASSLDSDTAKYLFKSILNLSRNNDMQMFFTINNYDTLRLLYKTLNDSEEFNDIKDSINIINITNTEEEGFRSYNYNIDNELL